MYLPRPEVATHLYFSSLTGRTLLGGALGRSAVRGSAGSGANLLASLRTLTA